MTEYKDTLNLPQTAFPMRADLAKKEPEILKRWQQLDVYAQLRQERQGKTKFVLHSGPPYANGHIHLGHAINCILKDIIVKAKSLQGFDAPLVPGWDCHGLPIELNVEKKIGKPGRKVDAKTFRQACRDYAQGFMDIQRTEFIRLGIIADWEHPYLTMAPSYEADIIRSLATIINKGYLLKGLKPVHWCLDCASALAEAEVEYKEKTSSSIDVRFSVVDHSALLERFDIHEPNLVQADLSIPIWTTTPWSLPGNVAVALNPELDYTLVQTTNGELLVIAEALVANVLERYNMTDAKKLASVQGKVLEGLLLQHPIFDKQVPVVLGEHVTTEAGTGAVHTAPAHGQDDYLIAKQYQLSMIVPVGHNGCFTAETPLVAGLHVSKVDPVIIDALREQKKLLHSASITHSYPHCWRHQTALIFLATPQWFISMDNNALREDSLEAIKHVDWIPEWGQARLTTMIANRPDWCISRQRTWGVPLALFIHKETGALHPEMVSLMGKTAELIAQEGIEAWYTLDKAALLGSDADQYIAINDVLDVWFDSGVSHQSVLKQRPDLSFPADIVLEGSDQHRGWFQSSLLTSIAMNGVEPYKSVLTHGFAVDPQGKKMSKSLGNVIAPNEVVQKLGADVLRLWVASVDYRYDITASNEILTRMSESYRRIRNTARFMLANLHGFDPATDLVPPEKMLALDQYIVEKAAVLQAEIIQAFETYQFHVVTQKLHHFCLIDLGGFYLDIIKDRQYTMQEESVGRRSAQTALYHLIQAFVRWMAPILSFTADEIWQYIPGNKNASVLMTVWYEGLSQVVSSNEFQGDFWETIRILREAVNKEIEEQRNRSVVGSSLEAEVSLYAEPDLKAKLDKLGDELRFLLITSVARVQPLNQADAEAAATEMPGLKLKVIATQYEKCVRCWHRTEDVNTNTAYPGLCARCVTNVSGKGEERHYV